MFGAEYRDCCPRDHEPLIVMERDGIELEHCPECRGTWFDEGELEIIAERAGASVPLVAALESATPARRTSDPCPRCGRKLETITVACQPEAVEIERCPSGDGFWLAHGDLRALLAGLAEGEGRPIGELLGGMFRYEIKSRKEGG